MSGHSTNMRLTALAMPSSAAVDVFGMGSEHPFANYWTAAGGITEVLGVMPSKEQADILVAKYFEIMDPMYPVIDHEEFMKTYTSFWALPMEGKVTYSPDIIALHFVLYATSTQFLEQASPDQRTKTAEFYISAAHQALRISSYWSHITIPTVQAMAMTFYFLINDNHVSDAWTFAGITVRQAYVLQLNRDPENVVPNASTAEKRLRLKIWQSIMHQDAALAMFLKMPPAAVSSDIGSVSYDVKAGYEYHMHHRMSVGGYMGTSPAEDQSAYDMGFAKSMWIFSNFIQENICKRRALGLPLANSNEHKRDVVSAFKSLRTTFPKPFNSLDAKRFTIPNARLARQQISLASNFFHSLMLLCVDENREAKVPVDVWGTLEAAHEGLTAFFAMNERFGGEVNGFWAYQHRAFEMAITMASLLDVDTRPPLPSTSGNSISQAHLLLKTAKEDVRHMLDVIRNSSGYFEYQPVQERRLDVLQAVYDRIRIV